MKFDLNNMSAQKLKDIGKDELPELASEVRQFLIDSISQTGGHIGANLGTVELSIALHYMFSSPDDAFVFDTGHIGYTHKIITGRAKMFGSLNTYGGMSRFVSRDESEHDFVEASHAGTSISLALGRALSLRNQELPNWSVAFIGDGSMAEGLALEALNHASVEPGIRMLIVLNDNGYAISPGFGAIHEYLKGRTTESSDNELLFTSLGYKVIGPVDGHSIEDLLAAISEAKESEKVCIIHAKTEKGKGLPPAKDHPFKLHFSFPFDPETGSAGTGSAPLNHQDIASQAIGECMERDSSVVAITPSTLYATGLADIFKRYPDRCFDPGMEEQHAATMAVGMALSGTRPVLFYQSTFLQRAYDQLFHDICFANQNVLIMTVRSGFAGYDNPTHHGIYDFSYLRSLPNLRVYYPKDAKELYEMTILALTEKQGPVLIHMPYGPINEDNAIPGSVTLDMDSPELICDGKDGVIVTVGNMVDNCLEAIELLASEGQSFGLVNVRRIKPLPEQELLEQLRDYQRVVTVEEGVLDGGVGAAVSALLHSEGSKAELLSIGLPCTFVEAGSNDELSEKYGLDAKGIEARISERWG